MDKNEKFKLTVEEGKLPKVCPKTKYWSVPVVYEMYGSITVEADSAEEAYDQVKEHPEEFDLPDEAFYVDDSLKVSDDDRENAVGTIKMLSCLDEAAESKAASGRHTGLTVKATVTFQKWEGDYARFNGEAEFDACDALDSMSDEELAQIERNDPYALDNVYLRAVAFGQIHDYDGPFEVDLDEDNLSDYLEARRKAGTNRVSRYDGDDADDFDEEEEDEDVQIGTQIVFEHSESSCDETEFDTDDEDEAMSLFEDFVEENGFEDVRVIAIRHDPIED